MESQAERSKYGGIHKYTVKQMKHRLATIIWLWMTIAASAADQGYFACLHLTDDQKAWFGSSGVSRCCNLADGMPTRYEERPDGVFIPPFAEVKAEADACRNGTRIDESDGGDHHHWMRVVDGLILRKNNPIGVGVVWWTNSGEQDPATEHGIRCFVGLPRV